MNRLRRVVQTDVGTEPNWVLLCIETSSELKEPPQKRPHLQVVSVVTLKAQNKKRQGQAPPLEDQLDTLLAGGGGVS